MVQLFQQTGKNSAAEPLWSFSYVDWQGRKRIGVGTESRLETQRLAERVQAEHDLLRNELRPKLEPTVVLPGTNSLADVRSDALVEATLPAETTDSVTPAPKSRKVSTVESPHSVRVGEQLINGGLITHVQLDDALDHQRAFGGRIIDVLIQLGYLTAEKFLVFMGNRPGIPRIMLDNYTSLPDDVLQLITADMARELEVIPIDRLGTTISLAMVCPVDLDALERIKQHTGLKTRPLLCSRPEFRKALRLHYRVNSTQLHK